MRWLHAPRSFGDKVSWLMTLISAVAIVAVSFVLAVANHLDLQRAAFASLQAQSTIVAMNSGAPMVFGDRASAVEALDAFRAMPNVISATLYEIGGKAFADYHRAAAGDADSAAPADPDEEVVSTTPVQEKGQPLGRLMVTYDRSALSMHLWRSLLLAAAISLTAMLLVLLFSRHITRVILRPMADLGDVAGRISQTKDYSLRASKTNDDEMGAFTDTFNDMLAQIQRQDIDIKSSREEAEIASRMKDEFLATLSHELRTPMTPIVGWAQILRRLGGPDARVLQAAEVIERNALVQTRIIDDLLDMSRIISGKMRLEMGTFAMRDVVSAALDTVREAAQAKGIALETTFDADTPLLRGDAPRIQQVLWNLLSNAIKFTQGGTIRLQVRHASAQVEVVVTDTGKGISADFLPYVFERFRQADSSITRAHGGLGLGLAIVKQLVELHGGTVAVASAGADRGSTFTVTLPRLRNMREGDQAVPAHTATGAMQTASVSTSLKGLRLAIVDDEPDTRDWIARVLLDHGSQVAAWSSAVEMIENLHDFAPDVLICDIGLPDMDGYALMREIRAMPAAACATPAIALTAFARAEDRARALAAGYQLHLGKPVDEASLVAAVASLAPAADAKT